jgi:hypothetical protein
MLRIARSEIVCYGIRARAGKIRHFAAVLDSMMRSRTVCGGQGTVDSEF